jgi:flagellar motility protein MotE (MotC chaperone)
MIRFARDFRLIPIVLLASVCLFALKVSSLVFDGGYTLAERLQNRVKPPQAEVTTAENAPAYPKITIADGSVVPDAMARAAEPRALPPRSWAQDMFNYKNELDKSDVTGSTKKEKDDITGSSGAKKEEPAAGGHGAAPPANAGPPLKTSEKPPESSKLDVGGNIYPLEPGKINSPGERAVLERLQDRRQELESRSRDIEMRENLLKAAEKRLEAKVGELKDVEGRISTAVGVRDKAEADRFKGIVAMYENMKSKDAARIFDRLDIKILVEVVTQIKPAKMSEIMAAMSSEAAERLTVELASRASATPKAQAADQLPKIEGKQSSN